MSLAGLIAIRGSVAVQKRPTTTVKNDLSSNKSWALVTSTLAIDLSVLDRKLAEAVWGLEIQADLYGLVVPGTDIKEQDGLQVSSGLYAGRNLRVRGVKEYKDSMGTDHLTVALQYTPTETFN